MIDPKEEEDERLETHIVLGFKVYGYRDRSAKGVILSLDEVGGTGISLWLPEEVVERLSKGLTDAMVMVYGDEEVN